MHIEYGSNLLTRGALASREACMAVAEAADRLGFSFLSVSDHVVVPRDIASRYPYSEGGDWAGASSGFCFDQLATLSFLAGCTKRVKLMTSVMVVPHRRPILTAKMLATADVLSGGRVIVGCGAGWMREEFEALEAKPFEARGQVTDEYIEAFKVLWTEEKPSYRGKFAAFNNIMFAPKPLQKPHPPIWIGGESPAAMRRAARLGDAWYPGSINPAHRLDSPARLGVAIAELHKMAAAVQRDPATLAVTHVVLSPVEWTTKPGHDTPRRMFTGSAADLAADATALAKLGISRINLSFQAPTVTATIERMQRFAEEVMPLV